MVDKKSETVLRQIIQNKHSLKYTAEFIYIKKKKTIQEGRPEKQMYSSVTDTYTGGTRVGTTILQSSWTKLSKCKKSKL